MLRRVVLYSWMFVMAACTVSGKTPQSLPTSTASPPTPGVTQEVPTSTPRVSSTPTAYTPFNVASTVDGLNVRVNPGYLFAIYGMVTNKGTKMLLLGKAPGGEWLYIQTPMNVKGWVFAQLVESSADVQAVPIIQPQNVVQIRGRVTDGFGIPISGLGFETKQVTDAETLTNVAMTDSNGEFYSFLPSSLSGNWTITYTAISCTSNAWKDNGCRDYKSGYDGNVYPKSATVILPQDSPLTFTWR